MHFLLSIQKGCLKSVLKKLEQEPGISILQVLDFIDTIVIACTKAKMQALRKEMPQILSFENEAQKKAI
jgi:hypothetical protein